jgi:hypothetical protein
MQPGRPLPFRTFVLRKVNIACREWLLLTEKRENFRGNYQVEGNVMSKLKILGFLGILSTALSVLAWAQAPIAPARPVSPTHSDDELAGLMRAKLASSQKVVEGLMAKDFDLIGKGALELTKVCDASQWHASDDQVYSHYRSELRRAAKKLILLAEEKNLDGSAYTYMHTLTTCISCHEYCRDVLHVSGKNSARKVVPIPVTDEDNDADQTKARR